MAGPLPSASHVCVGTAAIQAISLGSAPIIWAPKHHVGEAEAGDLRVVVGVVDVAATWECMASSPHHRHYPQSVLPRRALQRRETDTAP